MFVHLHWHSHYSLLKWYWTPTQIVQTAKNLWMKKITLTDIENLYWWIEFYETCKKEDIEPILWVELYFSPNLKLYKINQKEISGLITIIAKNFQWYQNLLKLISTAQIENFTNWKAFIDLETIQKFSTDLYFFFGWVESWLWKMILQNQNKNLIKETLKNIINLIWKENFLLEIQPQNPKLLPEYQKLNKSIYQLAQEFNINLIVNNNFFYPSKEDKIIFWILKAINENDFFDKEKHIPIGDYHIMSEKEILNNLNFFPFIENPSKLIENNLKIAEQINLEIPLWNILFPDYKVAPETEKLYHKYKDSLVEN